MAKENCKFCGHEQKAGQCAEWGCMKCGNKEDEPVYYCQTCKKGFDGSNIYDHRGFYFCEEHFDDGIEKVEHKRSEAIKADEHSTKSQRAGEFMNNHRKYGINDVAADGLPIIKPKTHPLMEEYERGEL